MNTGVCLRQPPLRISLGLNDLVSQAKPKFLRFDSFESGWHNVDRRPLVHQALVSDFHITLPLCFRLFSESWLAQVDSNHRPRAYQARALTT